MTKPYVTKSQTTSAPATKKRRGTSITINKEKIERLTFANVEVGKVILFGRNNFREIVHIPNEGYALYDFRNQVVMGKFASLTQIIAQYVKMGLYIIDKTELNIEYKAA